MLAGKRGSNSRKLISIVGQRLLVRSFPICQEPRHLRLGQNSLGNLRIHIKINRIPNMDNSCFAKISIKWVQVVYCYLLQRRVLGTSKPTNRFQRTRRMRTKHEKKRIGGMTLCILKCADQKTTHQSGKQITPLHTEQHTKRPYTNRPHGEK